MFGTALCATLCYILCSTMEALVNSIVERVLGSVDISGPVRMKLVAFRVYSIQ
jgi:hypothetical protein